MNYKTGFLFFSNKINNYCLHYREVNTPFFFTPTMSDTQVNGQKPVAKNQEKPSKLWNKKRKKRTKKSKTLNQKSHTVNQDPVTDKQLQKSHSPQVLPQPEESLRTHNITQSPELHKPCLLPSQGPSFPVLLQQDSDNQQGLSPNLHKSPAQFEIADNLKSPGEVKSPEDMIDNFEISPKGHLSPRKQTIMRYRKSDDQIDSGSIINEVRGSLKSQASNSSVGISNEGYDKTKIHVDEKTTLFKFTSSKILVFDDDINNSENNLSLGRLLGHGEFEIFQLHNGDVSYLSCGPSFIYPLLPKLKILRINLNQFILPLVNPERYWKIFINTENPDTIEKLENALEGVIRYRNLFVTSDKKSQSTSLSDKHNMGSSKFIGNNTMGFDIAHISNNIPDSPPSAPLSPSNNQGIVNDFQLDPPLPPPALNNPIIPKDNSNNSLSSALASLDINNPPQSPSSRLHYNNFQKPKAPSKYSNPYQQSPKKKYNNRQFDEKSDSSMDSLLDEYEENISISKSFSYSRGPSRPISRSSSFVNQPVYNRQEHILPQNDSYNNDTLDDDPFPFTSLSEYNKNHNTTSRRSSQSGLYASESNWMDPTMNPKTQNRTIPPHSRSTYSLASSQNDMKNSELNSTYKQIYKSIAQRNLSLMPVGRDRNDDIRSMRSLSRLPTIQQSKTYDSNHMSSTSNKLKHVPKSDYSFSNNKSKVTSSKSKTNLQLDSNDVYNMISSNRANEVNRDIQNKSYNTKSRASLIPRQNPQSSPMPSSRPQQRGFASRLFGW